YPRHERPHHLPLVEHGHRPQWSGPRAMEYQSIRRFLLPAARRMLGGSHVNGMPAKAPLFGDDGPRPERIAAVQRQGMVEDVKNPQRHAGASISWPTDAPSRPSMARRFASQL